MFFNISYKYLKVKKKKNADKSKAEVFILLLNGWDLAMQVQNPKL